MISLVTDLAKAYMAKHPGDTVDVWKDSIEAKGGIMGAAEGKLDIGMSARLLGPEEQGLGLYPMEIARVAAAMVVNAESVKLTSVKASQVCDIYSGKTRNWKELGGHDGLIRAFTRPEADSTKLTLRKGILCFSGLAEASYVATMPKAKDMYNALVNTPNSIGVADIVAVADSGGRIRALSLEGIEPTDENVKKGRWPIIKNYVLVTKGQPKGLAKRFVEFIYSPEGNAVIRENKAVPVQ